MPQFDPAFFASQSFWTIVSFAVLFVVLSRWVLPRVSGIINERTRLIEQEIEAAHQQHDEAEAIKLEYAGKLADIDREAKQMFDESEKRIIERRRQLMGEWKEEMERRKLRFMEDAEVARQQAIREIRAQSADLVADAAEQIIHQRIDEKEAKQALNEAIEAFETRTEKHS